eukprot:scaffold53461_cov82-Phaeocystis_antarctica.AAC.1
MGSTLRASITLAAPCLATTRSPETARSTLSTWRCSCTTSSRCRRTTARACRARARRFPPSMGGTTRGSGARRTRHARAGS